MAGLAFPLYFLVLSSWKGIGTGGTRFRDRGTASVIHSGEAPMSSDFRNGWTVTVTCAGLS